MPESALRAAVPHFPTSMNPCSPIVAAGGWRLLAHLFSQYGIEQLWRDRRLDKKYAIDAPDIEARIAHRDRSGRRRTSRIDAIKSWTPGSVSPLCVCVFFGSPAIQSVSRWVLGVWGGGKSRMRGGGAGPSFPRWPWTSCQICAIGCRT